MFCYACGNNNEDEFVFCEKCGVKLLDTEEDLKCNEVIEYLKYEGYEIIGNKSVKNKNRKIGQTQSRPQEVQKPKEIKEVSNQTQIKPIENKSIREEKKVKIKNKPQESNNYSDREAYIRELQKTPKDFELDYPHKNRSKSKMFLIITEVIVLIAIIIIIIYLFNNI